MQKKNKTAKNKARKFKRKAHNFILKTIALCIGTLWVISLAAIDSESWIPTIVGMACMIWLSIFAYANGMMNDYEEEGDF